MRGTFFIGTLAMAIIAALAVLAPASTLHWTAPWQTYGESIDATENRDGHWELNIDYFGGVDSLHVSADAWFERAYFYNEDWNQTKWWGGAAEMWLHFARPFEVVGTGSETLSLDLSLDAEHTFDGSDNQYDYSQNYFRLYQRPNGTWLNEGVMSAEYGYGYNEWNKQLANRFEFLLSPGSYTLDLYYRVLVGTATSYNYWSRAATTGSADLSIGFGGGIAGAGAVPEPTTLVLLGAGLLGLAGVRRRTKG